MTNKWNETVELIKIKITENIPTVMVSIFIFIIFYIIANYYKNLFIKDYIVSEEKYISLINNQIGWLIYYSILIIGIIFSLVNLGISIAAIVSLLATICIAFGLALQGTLSNIINGILISIYDIFSIGDVLKLNQWWGNTFEGTVVEFTLNNTTLLNNETKHLFTVPNSMIRDSIITNVTRARKY
jgi:small conductance mechanosensitive channel